MIVTETGLKGCLVIEPEVFQDDRGWFFEAYNQKMFQEKLGKISFVQDNQSFSRRGVIRALHYQRDDYAQAKLVRVLQGAVLDVAVDLRKDSATFGKHFAIELTSNNKKQLFIPRGFAHGFSVLSKTAEFFYKCDNLYNKESEGGIIFADSSLNIDWKIPESEQIISDRDRSLPSFEKAKF
ncbi:MAG: dTDP-4-dehydrorhamnose 3,5-epimerase [Bacteroidota bacterium]